MLKYSQKVISEDFLADNIITADSEIDFHSGGLIEQENPQKSTKVVSIKNLLGQQTNYKMRKEMNKKVKDNPAIYMYWDPKRNVPDPKNYRQIV